MIYTMTCAECGTTFHASRRDAITCSGRCRMARNREAIHARQEARERTVAAEIAKAVALLSMLRGEGDARPTPETPERA
jgi:hypothetical protein